MKKLMILGILLMPFFTIVMAQNEDFCVNAEGQGEYIDCSSSGTYMVSGTNASAGDDAELTALGGCWTGEASWFEVEFDPAIPTFSISGSGDFILMEGPDCGSLTEVTCGSLTDEPVIPGTVYWIAIPNGEDVTITYPLGIPTGECPNAIDLSELNCGDPMVSEAGDSDACPDNEATACMGGVEGIWYTFTTGATLPEFTIDGDYELFEGSDCSSLNFLADCGVNTVAADPSTTYFVLTAPNGFDITLPTPPANEECSSADPLSGTATGDNSCATADTNCGGDHSVWYEVEVLVGATTLDIDVTGAIGNPMVTIFADDCSTQVDDGANCASTATATCLAAGDYFIEVSSASVDAGTFDITETQTQPGPAEDICDSALDLSTGPVLNCGDNPSEIGNTAACPDAEAQGCMTDVEGIWYTFTTAASLGNFDISGEYELFEGSCTSLNLLADCAVTTITTDPSLTYFVLVGPGGVDFTTPPSPPNPDCASAEPTGPGYSGNNCCSPTDATMIEIGPDGQGVTITVDQGSVGAGYQVNIYRGDCNGTPIETGNGPLDVFEDIATCGESFFIEVLSDADGCGDYTVDYGDVFCNSPFSEDCSAAEQLAQPATNSGVASCLASCNQFTCNGPGACGDNMVWFEVFTDIDASVMFITITGIDGQVTVFQDDCSNGLLGCTGFSDGDETEVAVNANLSYFIGVQSDDPGEFEICVETEILAAMCSDGTLTPSRPDNPVGNPEGPYCPGEKVLFTYDLEFTVDPIGQGNNCQWLQGILPSLGGGWDIPACDPANQPPPGWFWLPGGEVDHNVNSPILGIQTGANGQDELVYGPGGLGAGDLLPAGWWFTSNGGGAGCTNDGDPDNMWGLPAGCGSTVSLSFNFFLQVRDDIDPLECLAQDPDFLKVHMFTMADGQTGCWSNNACASDLPAIFDASVQCNDILVSFDGSHTVCFGDETDILARADDGSSTMVIQIHEDSPFDPGGYPIEEDGEYSINDRNNNQSCELELVIYEGYTIDEDSGCKGPSDTFHVFFIPEMRVELPDDLIVCAGDDPVMHDLNTMCSDSPYAYNWDPDDNTNGSTVTLPHRDDLAPGFHSLAVTVTDAYGCELIEFVEYTIQEDPMLTLDGPTAICVDATPDQLCAEVNNPNVNVGDIDWLWEFTPPNVAFVGGDNDEQCVQIDDAASTPGNYQLKITATVNGCDFEFVEAFSIGSGPRLQFRPGACQGDSIKVIGLDLNKASGDQLYITQSPSGVLMAGDTIAGPSSTDSLCVWTMDFTTPLTLHSSGGCAILPETITLPPKPSLDITATTTDICSGEDVTITVNNPQSFPNGLSWTDGVTTTSGSMINASPGSTTTYTFTGIDLNFCEDVSSVTITVNPNPETEITGSLSYCAGQSTTLTANSNGGTMPFTYSWSDNSSGPSISPSTAGPYSVTVTDANGCTDEDAVSITEEQNLTPSISAPAFCEGDMTTVDGGDGFDSYAWVGPNGEIESTQTFMTDIPGDWTLTVVQGGCDGTGTITVTEVADLPLAIDTQPLTVCNEDTGTLGTSVNLSALVINGVTGIWTEGADNVGDPSNVDFAGAGAGTRTYTFTTNSATAPCENVEYTVEVIVENCGCPSVAVTNLDDFCLSTAAAYDLLGITTTAEAGSWSITPASIIINGTMLEMDASTDAGTYTLVYTLDDAVDPNCEQSSVPVEFTVWSELGAVLSNDSACNTSMSGNSTVVTLSDLIDSGNSSGEWTSTDVSIPPDGIVDFDGLALGMYTFTYTVIEAGSACPPFEDDITITVVDCGCPILLLDDLPDLCNDGGTFNLNDFLTSSDPGSWSVMPTLNTPGGIVLSSGVAADTYVATYTLDAPVTGCPDFEISKSFNIYEAPSATVESGLDVCNGDQIQPLPAPTNINLNDYVTGSAGGVWTAPIEYKLGVLDDETAVDFIDVPTGVYTFTYTTNTASAPCTDEPYLLSINVRPCNCPEIILDQDQEFCAQETGLIFLDDFILNPMDAPAGAWSTGNSPGPSNVNAIGGVDPSSFIEGTYSFVYTFDDEISGCSTFAILDIIFQAQPEVEINDFTACNVVQTTGEHCVNIERLIDNPVPPGSWAQPANYTSTITDFTDVCFDAYDIGDQFVFTYTVDNSATGGLCPDVDHTATITVVDCNCPTIALMDIDDPICTQGSQVDMTQFIEAFSVPGTLSVVDATGADVPLIFSVFFDASQVDPGTYTLILTPNDPPTDPLCPEDDQVTFTVIAPPNAGSGMTIEVCPEDASLVNLEGALDGADSGGMWTETSGAPSTGSAFDDTAATFDAVGQREGTYTFEYSLPGSGPCPGDASTITVEILSSPVADAGSAGPIACDETATLGGPNTSVGDYTYSWTDDGGNEVGTEINLTVSQPGTYTLLVTDNNTLCIAESMTTVDGEDNTVSQSLQDNFDPCGGGDNSVQVIATGGDGNYTYQLDGVEVGSADIGNLMPGQTYTITTIDGTGCEFSETFTVPDATATGADAGEDRQVDFSDSLTTNITVTPNAAWDLSTLVSAVWIDNATGEVLCDDTFQNCATIPVNPDIFNEYCVTVTDINGCTASDCVIVRETLERDVFIPNVFTPADDVSGNQVFRPYYDSFIEGVTKFNVYDRWGELVFSADLDQLNNDPNYGWFGTWDNDPGRQAEQGVYVYVVEILYVNNTGGPAETEIFAGDVTIYR